MPPTVTKAKSKKQAAKRRSAKKAGAGSARTVGPDHKIPAKKGSSKAPPKGSAKIWIGDCREKLAAIPEVRAGMVDLVFADPPFNWNRAYDRWDDKMPEDEYLTFTEDWIRMCADGLRPGGAMWINIPDDWAAEIVVYCKRTLELQMVNWCIWHYRFGQNTTSRFINSKVHALYFIKPEAKPEHVRTWNPDPILELSDRAAIYADPRTETKRDGMPARHRVPMDVWYGQFWGRIQGNNKERRHYHDNQLPEVYLERVILACTNKGDTVLDPFTGSGTTAVVARDHNRNYVGTEFSEENAGFAAERIKAGMVRTAGLRGTSTAIHKKRSLA